MKNLNNNLELNNVNMIRPIHPHAFWSVVICDTKNLKETNSDIIH